MMNGATAIGIALMAYRRWVRPWWIIQC